MHYTMRWKTKLKGTNIKSLYQKQSIFESRGSLCMYTEKRKKYLQIQVLKLFTIHNPIKKSKSGKGSSPEYSIISTLQKTHRTYLYSLYMLGTI